VLLKKKDWLKLFAVTIVNDLDILPDFVLTVLNVNFVLKVTVSLKRVHMMYFVPTAVAIIQLLVLHALHISNDMRLLQHNIQSICTSLPLLQQAVQRLQIDTVLLQEIWHPPEDFINVINYNKPITMLRNGRQVGDVAIITHNSQECQDCSYEAV